MDLATAEKSILKTLTHFDVLDYPLTLLEIAKFNELGLPATEIFKALNNEPLTNLISQTQGLYYLKGRETLIPLRLARWRLALKKLKRARRFATLFSFFPWIRAVAVYSSLSLKNSQADSDIDLFFITQADRAWSARFFINSFLKLFRLRPTPGNSRDKLCASYWVDENNIDLSVFNINTDYYYYYGGAAYVFLAGLKEIENRFRQTNNWIQNIFPAWQPNSDLEFKSPTRFGRFIQDYFEDIFSLWPERSYRDWQMKILPQKYLDNNDGKKVALGRGVIKLHDNDKRGEYNKLFKESYEKYCPTPVIPTEVRYPPAGGRTQWRNPLYL